MNINEVYEEFRNNPSTIAEENLYKEIIKYSKRFVRKYFGDHWDTFEDAVSETALKVYTRLPTFKGESRFSTWLYPIVKTECLMLARERATLKGSLYYEDLEDPNWVEKCDSFDSKGLIVQMRNKLTTPEDIELFELKLEGYDNSEIAEKMGLPEGTIKSRWYYLKNNLKKLLKN